jgi:hypothetical protein
MNENKDTELVNLAFYANNFVITLAGRDVFINFQRLAPRFEMANPQSRYNVNEHDTVILNVATFKDMISIGANLIKQLEDKFGDITTPEFINRLNASQQDELNKLEKRETEDERPHYLG